MNPSFEKAMFGTQVTPPAAPRARASEEEHDDSHDGENAKRIKVEDGSFGELKDMFILQQRNMTQMMELMQQQMVANQTMLTAFNAYHQVVKPEPIPTPALSSSSYYAMKVDDIEQDWLDILKKASVRLGQFTDRSIGGPAW